MIKKIGNEEIEFNVKLGTTIKIRKAFNKPFNDVLRGLDKLDVEDLIKLLYCGVNPDVMSKESFKELILENVGLMELYELVQSFIKKIQYPGLSEEEIDKKLEEKNLEAQKMGINTTSLNN